MLWNTRRSWICFTFWTQIYKLISFNFLKTIIKTIAHDMFMNHVCSFLNIILPVDDFEFNVEQFLPVSFESKILDNEIYPTLEDAWFLLMSQFLFQFLDSMFSQLFELLKEVQECDTKVIHCTWYMYTCDVFSTWNQDVLLCVCVFTILPLGRSFLCLMVPWVSGLGLEAWIDKYMYMYEVYSKFAESY